MSTDHPVELNIDLRGYSGPIQRGEDIMRLWQEVAPALAGKELLAGRTLRVAHPNSGEIGIEWIARPSERRVVRADDAIVIRSVLESPRLRVVCQCCRAKGVERGDLFECWQCGDPLCEEHSTFLDGALRAYCPAHAPRCSSGAAALPTFWCLGPKCRGTKAWSEPLRQRHRADRDVWYCRECYLLVFPPCAEPGCSGTGTATCEFVLPNLQPCGKQVCPRHSRRWQIFGPEKEGLALCSAHRHIRSLTDHDLVHQIVAGTAVRRLQRRDLKERHENLIPTLGSMEHILRKARDKTYQLERLQAMFDQYAATVTGNSALEREIGFLLKHHRQGWERAATQASTRKAAGQPAFESLQQLLVGLGLPQVAQALVYADYKPNARLLFVELSPEFRGLLIGRGGATIKSLQLQLGVKIAFEKEKI